MGRLAATGGRAEPKSAILAVSQCELKHQDHGGRVIAKLEETKAKAAECHPKALHSKMVVWRLCLKGGCWGVRSKGCVIVTDHTGLQRINVTWWQAQAPGETAR